MHAIIDIVTAVFDFGQPSGWIGVVLILFVVAQVATWWNEG